MLTRIVVIIMLPVTNGVSLMFSESTIRRPTPGHANTVSVRTLPPSTPAKLCSHDRNDRDQSISERMRHNDCFFRDSLCPAQFLNTPASETSNIDDLVVLVSVAIRPVPIVTAGSTID